jgi:small conductance mechanosensitive channel
MEELVDLINEEAALWTTRIFAVVVILAFFYVLSKISKRAIAKASVRLNLDGHLSSLIARSVSITLMLFGLVTALGTLGINVSALVAGLGLTGFALGFALKDIISNLLSGVLILLYRPFKIGNTIKIAGFEGEVVAIDLRYTELNSEGEKILMPNSKLFTDPITVVQPKEDEDPATTEGAVG